MKRKPRRRPRMTIDVVTLFPEILRGTLRESMIRLARTRGIVDIKLHLLRRFGEGKHKVCDDKPFGGGPGMIMKPGPVFRQVESIVKKRGRTHVVFFTPQGKTFKQKDAERLARKRHIILVCGRYEGLDERVREYLVDEEISIGDFILTGGEIPALCVLDAVVRLLPGVLGNPSSLESESFESGLLDYPQYTRPRVYRGYSVPEVLFSGNHKIIEKWRLEQALKRTKERRPDLYKKLRSRDATRGSV